MRYSFSLATGLALTLLTTEQHALNVHAARAMAEHSRLASEFKHQGGAATTQTTKTGQAHQTKAGAAEAEAPVIREVDLEGLKKLLRREAGADARPLLVNFWATWCGPCREEFPDLVRIKADYAKRNLEVITISLDDPAEIKSTVTEFLREVRSGDLPAYLLNVIDPDFAINMVDPEWHGGLPATFLYDASGKMTFKQTGRFGAKELREAIDKVTTAK
ncbi:MAG TPA: TlpA disulfide reductase family protein [Pyrinomonadaceae bacterium]|jgi:thiol-disulfide isomerase/thioredoxin